MATAKPTQPVATAPAPVKETTPVVAPGCNVPNAVPNSVAQNSKE